MEKPSTMAGDLDIIEVEEGNGSWWCTLLPAAVEFIFCSCLKWRLKQSQPPPDDDDDDDGYQNIPSKPDQAPVFCPISSDVSSTSTTSCTTTIRQNYKYDDDDDHITTDQGEEVKLERFKVKPRNFINATTKN